MRVFGLPGSGDSLGVERRVGWLAVMASRSAEVQESEAEWHYAL